MYFPLERREALCNRIWLSPLGADLEMIIAVDNTQVIDRYGCTELPSSPVADTFVIINMSFVHFKTQNVIM